MWGPWLDPTHQRLPHGAPFSFFIFFRSKGLTHLIPLDLFRSPAQPSSCSRQTRSGMRTPRSSSQSVSISEGGAPLLSYLVGGFVGSGRGDDGNSHPQRLGLKILPRFKPTQRTSNTLWNQDSKSALWELQLGLNVIISGDWTHLLVFEVSRSSPPADNLKLAMSGNQRHS